MPQTDKLLLASPGLQLGIETTSLTRLNRSPLASGAAVQLRSAGAELLLPAVKAFPHTPRNGFAGWKSNRLNDIVFFKAYCFLDKYRAIYSSVHACGNMNIIIDDGQS